MKYAIALLLATAQAQEDKDMEYWWTNYASGTPGSIDQDSWLRATYERYELPPAESEEMQKILDDAIRKMSVLDIFND